MSEFFKSLLEAMHRRTATSIIGTYFTFWALFHWQVFYVTLFVSQQIIFTKFGMMKNEYINHYFLGIRLDQLSYYFDFLAPVLLTWLYIWKLPDWLFIRSFKVERRHKLDKRIVLIEGETELEKKRLELASQNTKTLVEEKKAVAVEQEIIKIDPTKGLDKEYEQYIKRPYGKGSLIEIKDTVYKHFGFIGDYQNPSNGRFEVNHVNSNYIAMAHTNGLIKFNKDNTQITLTDKGLHFLSRQN
jgi:hypothetical protein